MARLRIALWGDPSVSDPQIEREADTIFAEFEASGDERGLASIWELRAMRTWHASRGIDTIEAYDRAVAHAVRAQVIDFPAANLIIRFGPLSHGPFTTGEITERLAALAPDAHMRFALEAHIALVEGRYEDALSLNDQGVARLEALGLPVDFVPPIDFRAGVLHEQGRFDEALQLWRHIHSLHREHEEIGFLSTSLIQAAQTLLALGELEEADCLALEGEELGGPDDLINFAFGRRIRALAALRRGELAEAEALARSAVDYGYRADFPRHRGEAHDALGTVLRAAGRPAEARTEYERASRCGRASAGPRRPNRHGSYS